MWSLLGWWLMVRVVAVALFGIERSALAAEMAAVAGGMGAGIVLRLGLAGAVQRMVDQGKAQLRTAAAVPVGPPVLLPQQQAGASPPVSGRHLPDPEKTVHELEETLDSAGVEALEALFADSPAPVAAPKAPPVPAKVHLGAAVPVAVPVAVLAVPFAGLGDSAASKQAEVDFDDLLGTIAGAPLPPIATAQMSAPAFAPLGFQKPPVVDPEQTSVVPTEPSSVWVPPRAAEATRAYAGSTGEAIRAAIEQAQDGQRPPPRVRLSNAVQRDAQGNLQWWLDGRWEALPADLIQAVAVGLVEHSNFPDAQPEIWIDVIYERGSPGQRAEAVRIHLSRDALQRFAPDLSAARAFGNLAAEFAEGGALRLPQRPVWPGPPWPRYGTAAEFVAMWQRELG